MAAVGTKTVANHSTPSPAIDELEAEVEKRLHFSHHAGLRHISYRIDEGTVVLHGRVPSYYLKQLAQVKVTCVPGVQRVDNRIEVAVS